MNAVEEPHPRPACVPVDEPDAGGFESPPNGKVDRRCHHSRFLGQFDTPDGRDATGTAKREPSTSRLDAAAAKPRHKCALID